jgi:hypothetical protein
MAAMESLIPNLSKAVAAIIRFAAKYRKACWYSFLEHGSIETNMALLLGISPISNMTFMWYKMGVAKYVGDQFCFDENRLCTFLSTCGCKRQSLELSTFKMNHKKARFLRVGKYDDDGF